MKEFFVSYFPLLIFAILFPIFLLRNYRQVQKRTREREDNDSAK